MTATAEYTARTAQGYYAWRAEGRSFRLLWVEGKGAARRTSVLNTTTRTEKAMALLVGGLNCHGAIVPPTAESVQSVETGMPSLAQMVARVNEALEAKQGEAA